MDNTWSNGEIINILLQLDEQSLPFTGYTLHLSENLPVLIGQGGSAVVFEAEKRFSHKSGYALKVIGFKNQTADSEAFLASVQAQEGFGIRGNVNTVRIYDYTELVVSLDEENRITAASKASESANEANRVISEFEDSEKSTDGHTIRLQFVLMEKLPPVYQKTDNGKNRIVPEQLTSGEETELLKLAYDIGSALKSIHDKNILHRDIKPENLFYDETSGHYKLGDFGIAKRTENGFAGTVAFTPGYVAPEVRAVQEKYDKTADIYSFGMTLYFLSNGLKFPNHQDCSETGILPRPERKISAGFYKLLVKACMYDPDQRYQSADEMLPEIEKLMDGFSAGYKAEHRNTTLLVGTVTLLAGIIAWILTISPETSVEFTVWEYIFLAFCMGKGILKFLKTDVVFMHLCVLATGIGMLVSTGFSWIKLILVVLMTVSSGLCSVYLSAAALSVGFTSFVLRENMVSTLGFSAYNWIAILLASLAAAFLEYYGLMSMRMTEPVRNSEKRLHWKNLYWIEIGILYLFCVIAGFLMSPAAEIWYRNSFGVQIGKVLPDLGNYIDGILLSVGALNPGFDIGKVGLCGLIFCAFWFVRELVLIKMQQRRSKQ